MHHQQMMAARFEFAVDTDRRLVVYRDERILPEATRRKLDDRRDAGLAKRNVVLPRVRLTLDEDVKRAKSQLKKENAKPYPNTSEVARLTRAEKAAGARRRETVLGAGPDGLRRRYLDAGLLTIVLAETPLIGYVGVQTNWVIAMILLFCGSGVAVAFIRWCTNDPRDLTAEDEQAIDDATRTLDLPLPAPARKLNKHSQDAPTPALIACAIDLGWRVESTKSWSSIYLDSHRVQFNPGEEVRQIVAHSLEFHAIGQSLGTRPVGTTATAEAARRAFDIAREPLNTVWTSLVERISALEEYCTHLEQLDVELANAEAAKRAIDLTDDIGRLLANAVADELATSHTERLSREAAGLSAAINDLIQALNGDLHTLRAFGSAN